MDIMATVKKIMLISTCTLTVSAMELMHTNGNGIKKEKSAIELVRSAESSLQKALEKLLAECVIHKVILSLPILKEKLNSLNCSEIAKWLKTPSGFEFLIESAIGKYANFKHQPKVICLIKLGAAVKEVRPHIKEYLENNPKEKESVEHGYFHRLLSNTTTDEDIRYFHEIGLALYSRDQNGATWLMGAVMQNASLAVRHLVEQKEEYQIDLKAKDKDGNNAFYYALADQYINKDIVTLLLQSGLTNPENLHLYIEHLPSNNQLEIEKQKELQAQYTLWEKACIKAITTGAIEELQNLLDSNDAEDFVTRKGFKPLHWAIERSLPSKRLAIVSFLLNQFPNQKNSLDEFNMTPLHHAALKGDLAVTNLLIERGAEPNTLDKYDRTPLFWARQENHHKIAKVLEGCAHDDRSKNYA